MKKIKLLISALLIVFSNHSFAEFNAGLDASALAIQYMMADPPLPMINAKEKTYKGTVKPGYLTGDTEANYDYGGGAISNQTGSVSGPSLGGSYSYALSNKWGTYLWLVGTSLSGDFETKQNGESTPSVYSRNAKITHFNFSGGMSYQTTKKEEDGYSFSIFFGPYFPYYNFSQNYENQNEGLDIEIESSELFAGILVGVQWDIDVGEKWGLNPFFIFGDTFGSNAFFNPFGDSGECKTYDVTKTNSGNINTAGIGESDCGNRKEFLFDTQIGGLGLNLSYKPWDMTINLFAPFINRYIFKIFYEDETPELYYLSVSWNFGDYQR